MDITNNKKESSLKSKIAKYGLGFTIIFFCVKGTITLTLIVLAWLKLSN